MPNTIVEEAGTISSLTLWYLLQGTWLATASECMNDRIYETRWRHDWSTQLYTKLWKLRNQSVKQNRAWTGLEPMWYSAILVQCSTNWVIKPTASLSRCKFVIYRSWWRYKWIYERPYIWTEEKDKKTWMIIAVIHATWAIEIKAWKKLEWDSNPWPV